MSKFTNLVLVDYIFKQLHYISIQTKIDQTIMAAERLFDFIYDQQKNHPLEKSLGRKDDNGKWMFYSTGSIIEQAEKAASGLIGLGLDKGDRVAISSYKNSPEWTIMDLACQMSGMVSIPLYPTISSREYEFVLNNSQTKMAFCGPGDLYEKLQKAKLNTPSLDKIFSFDENSSHPYWKDMFSSEHADQVEEIKKAVHPDDLATIIYTSGTTGNPKGVMLTHRNIAHVVHETVPVLPGKPGDNALSFLPLCHIFERAVSFGLICKNLSVHFTGTDNLGGDDGDLKSVKPVFFSTVPRLLEKVYESIYNKGLALGGTKEKLFFWALGLTDTYTLEQDHSFVDGLKWKVADKLIFSKWREALGGNVQAIVTGAAACPVKIMRVFCAAGIPIREGYGLTETSPTLTVNTLDDDGVMLGTVGPVIKGVDLIIDSSEGEYKEDEGEILAFGPNVTQGYYENPEANAAIFKMIDGKKWFRTGDIGKFVESKKGRKFLKITDRKKELLKTSGGKYVAPAPIENRMRESFFIEQMMVIGEKQKFVSALIVPAPEALKDWCLNNDIEFTSLADACNNEKVNAHYQEIINGYNPEFSHIEQIKKFKLLPVEWLPLHEDGATAELTPTQKLKRRVIREKFGYAIDEIYNV